MRSVPSTDGVVLAVHDLGTADPGAPPLLLCHATGFHGRVWRALAELVPERRCLAIDFRGFGDSTEQTSGSLTWDGFADDVLAVVDALDLAPVQAVGHSKGGAAILLAEQARPGTIERAVCFEPIVFPPADRPGPNHLAEITKKRRETFPSHAEAIANFAAKPPLGSLRPDVLDDYVRHGFVEQDDGTVRLKARREHESMTYEMGARHSGFAHLREVACPVLVAHGGDLDGPAQLAPLVAEQLPRGELRAFPDLGHFGPLEDPEAFAAVVRDFLGAG